MKRCVLMKGLLLLLLAWLFVTIFSISTSPLYGPIASHPDSPIFQIIGRYWAEGDLPYVDLWDLKGPYIFLVNSAGYWLTGSRLGIYAIQIVSLYFTILFTVLTYKRHFKDSHSLLLVLLSLAGLSYVYQEGNLCEEYLLPFLSLSFYMFVRWIDRFEATGVPTHSPWCAVIYGMVLGLSLMSRLTNSLSVCCATAVVAICLLARAKYSNLLSNILAFFAGFIITTLPFALYFHAHDALAELWKGCFLYPLQYAGHPSKDIWSEGLHFYLLSFGNTLLLLSISVTRLIQNHRADARSMLWFFAALLPLVWFCWGNAYGQYGMTVFPLLTVSMIEMKLLRLDKLRLLTVTLVVIGFASKIRHAYIMRHFENPIVAQYDTFLKHIPSIDYASFVAYNCDPNFYLATNIHPAAPFFALQDFAIERNESLRNVVIASFQERMPTWILLNDINGHPAIEQLLTTSYWLEKHDAKRNLKLYRKSNDDK